MTQSHSGRPIIAGLGTALPEHRMTQDEAVDLAERICCRSDAERSLIRVLYRRSGVRQRYTALPHRIAFDWLEESVPAQPQASAVIASANGHDAAAGEVADGDAQADRANGHARGPSAKARRLAALSSVADPAAIGGPTTGERMQFFRDTAPPLALRASGKALADAQCEPASITHVVTVSCTGFFAPGIDVTLIEQLGLPRTVERLQVGFMGCHGAINGLQAAVAIVRADPRCRVLLCAVEVCSLHYCFGWEPARAVGNAVFADGAAALVIEAGAGAGGSGNESDRWQVAATGSCLIPESADAMTWQIGDRGFEMCLSPTVPDVIQGHLRGWLEAWLAEHGQTIGGIGSWAVHPGGPRILAAVEETLGLPRSATAVSREILATCGNMSSPTVLFIIEQLQAAGCPRPCVALGFGPGLTAEAALFV